MAQHIGVLVIDKNDITIEHTDLNVHTIVKKSLENPKAYPLLSSIDEYGTTLIRKLEAKSYADELKQLDLTGDEHTTAEALLNTLEHLEAHTAVKLVGD